LPEDKFQYLFAHTQMFYSKNLLQKYVDTRVVKYVVSSVVIRV